MATFQQSAPVIGDPVMRNVQRGIIVPVRVIDIQTFYMLLQY